MTQQSHLQHDYAEGVDVGLDCRNHFQGCRVSNLRRETVVVDTQATTGGAKHAAGDLLYNLNRSEHRFRTSNHGQTRLTDSRV
jgi:hypothetical protein